MADILVVVTKALASATTMTPKIMMAMSSSRSVSPRSSPSRVAAMRFCIASYLDLREDAVHRRDEGDGDESDHPAHCDDDGRFEECGQFSNLVIEFGLEIFGRHFELVVQRSGLLAHPKHLYG